MITTTLITHRSSDLFVSLRWDLLIISYYFFWLAVDKTTIAIPIIFLSVLALIQHDIERKIRQIDILRVSLCMCVCVRCAIWPLAENTNNKQQQSGMNQPSKGKSYSRLFFFSISEIKHFVIILCVFFSSIISLSQREHMLWQTETYFVCSEFFSSLNLIQAHYIYMWVRFLDKCQSCLLDREWKIGFAIIFHSRNAWFRSVPNDWSGNRRLIHTLLLIQ